MREESYSTLYAPPQCEVVASELAEKIMKERPPGSHTIVRAVLRSPLVLNGGCANLQNSAAIVTAIAQTIWHSLPIVDKLTRDAALLTASYCASPFSPFSP